MSNIEVKSGESVTIGGVTNSQETVKIAEPSVNVAITAGVSNDLHHTHDQNSASATWNIQHNLGKKPSVVIVDSADTVLYGHIEYTDLNNLTITLSAPTSGKAYIN